jgi:hypothetical protein
LNLTFDAHGQVRGLYTEAIDLHILGPLRIRRATNIEFSNASQQWEVRSLQEQRLLFTHPSRANCLDWEQRNLNS